MTIIEKLKYHAEIKKTIPKLYGNFFNSYEYYKTEYLKNECKIEILYYDLENVKGVDYTKQKNTYNKNAHIEKYYKISDEIERLEKENKFITGILRTLETVRDSIKDQELQQRITDGYFYTLF